MDNKDQNKEDQLTGVNTRGQEDPSKSGHDVPSSADNGPDWIAIDKAAHLLGVNKRTVRRWAQKGQVTARKDPHSKTWEVKADTLPKEGRVDLSGRKSSGKNGPDMSELVKALSETQKQAMDLAARNGWLEGQLNIQQKLLPEAKEDAARRVREAEEAKALAKVKTEEAADAKFEASKLRNDVERLESENTAVKEEVATSLRESAEIQTELSYLKEEQEKKERIRKRNERRLLAEVAVLVIVVIGWAAGAWAGIF